MSEFCEAERPLLSNRMDILERKVQHLIDESVETMYLKATVAEVDGRIKALETAQTPGAPGVESRLAALESSLHELGAHFVRYQEGLVAILVREVKKFEGIGQQVQIQERNIQAFVQEAISRTKAEMMGALDSTRDPISISCTSGSNSDACMSSSTTAGEESEKQGRSELGSSQQRELEKLMLDARQDIDVIYSDLRAHTYATEKRLRALENGHVTPDRQLAEVVTNGLTAQEGLTLSRSPSSVTNPLSKSLTELASETEIKAPQLPPTLTSSFAKQASSEKPPSPGVPQFSLTELDTVLQDLTGAINKCCPPFNLDHEPSTMQGPRCTPPTPKDTIERSHDTVSPPNPDSLPVASSRSLSVETTKRILEPPAKNPPYKISTPRRGDESGHRQIFPATNPMQHLEKGTSMESLETLSGVAESGLRDSCRRHPTIMANCATDSSSRTSSLKANRMTSLEPKYPKSSPAQAPKMLSHDASCKQCVVLSAKPIASNNNVTPNMGHELGSSTRTISPNKFARPGMVHSLGSSGQTLIPNNVATSSIGNKLAGSMKITFPKSGNHATPEMRLQSVQEQVKPSTAVTQVRTLVDMHLSTAAHHQLTPKTDIRPSLSPSPPPTNNQQPIKPGVVMI